MLQQVKSKDFTCNCSFLARVSPWLVCEWFQTAVHKTYVGPTETRMEKEASIILIAFSSQTQGCSRGPFDFLSILLRTCTEMGSIFKSNSRMLPVVFAPKFLSHSFLFPSSYQPRFFSIFSTFLSICIYPLSSRAFWSSYSLLQIYRVLFIWLAPFLNFSIVACLRTRTPNEDPVR